MFSFAVIYVWKAYIFPRIVLNNAKAMGVCNFYFCSKFIVLDSCELPTLLSPLLLIWLPGPNIGARLILLSALI